MSPITPRRKQKSKTSTSTADSPRPASRTAGMKVIQVGKNSQSRIAQACDRCRTKKIRCDGLRPTCSACTTVGFECRTSDKLSRRAFPRGYTECLEDRVRELEEENRAYLERLDKTEAALSPVAETSEVGQVVQPDLRSTGVPMGMERSGGSDQGGKKLPKFMTDKPRLLLDASVPDQFFMGMSSGRTFIELFCRKMQETVRANPSFTPTSFIQSPSLPVLSTMEKGDVYPTAHISETLRPQMHRLVTMFFTQWASLFPVLDRGTFLTLYDVFYNNPERVKDPLKLAQIYLVLSLSGVAARGIERDDVRACELMWQHNLKEAGNTQSMEGLQCHLLACIYSLMRGQHVQVTEYRALAVATAMRLGLHHSQRNFTFGPLVRQVRKKVFWTLYTVDCFAAASLGLPRLLNSNFCHCEFPLAVDDESITEQGILPTLPGSPTRISTALSLYQLSKLFAEILDYAFSVCDTEIDMEKLKKFDSELMTWEQNLPQDQRVEFHTLNDRPQFPSRMDGPPVLGIIYYYLRTLLNRIILERNLSNWFNIAVDAIARYSRRIVILTGILDEQSLAFTLPLAKTDLLALSGFAILLKGILQCPPGSKMSPSNPPPSLVLSAPLLSFIRATLFRYKAAGALDFAQAVSSFIHVEARPSNTAETRDVGGVARSVAGSHVSSTDLAFALDNTQTTPGYIRQSVALESVPALSNADSAEDISMREQADAPIVSGLGDVGRAGLTAGSMLRPLLFSGAGIMPTNPGDRGYEFYSLIGSESGDEPGQVLSQDNDAAMSMRFSLNQRLASSKTEHFLDLIYGNFDSLTDVVGFDPIAAGHDMTMSQFQAGMAELGSVDPAALSLAINHQGGMAGAPTDMEFVQS